MALIKCDECGVDVSSKAVSCPKCGNPIYTGASIPPTSTAGVSVSAPAIPGNSNASARRKLGGGLAAFLVAVIAFTVYESQSPGTPTPNTTTNENNVATVSPPPSSIPESSPTEQAAAAPTPAPINVSLDALPGWPQEQPKKVSLDTLYNDYQANEVAADNKYRGHLLMVSGPINRIAKDLLDRTYLALNLERSVFDVAAVLASPYIPTAATLAKGQTVTLVCVGDGKAITPNLKDCAIAVINGTVVSLKQAAALPGAPTAAKIVADGSTTGQTGFNRTPLDSPSDQATVEASFDCKKAHSTSEMLICGDADLAQLDRDLAQLYAQAKAAASNEKAFAKVTTQNWNWRERNCRDKACLVNWYGKQKRRFEDILNASAQSHAGETAQPAEGASSSL
ncbi:OB-fold protein [Paraburkholderia hospita]